MKQIAVVLALFVITILMFDKIVSQANKIHSQEATIAAWRSAATPVFATRGTVNIANHATPRDLACYLDKGCPVVWQEWFKYRRNVVKEAVFTYDALGNEVGHRRLTPEEERSLDSF